MVENWWSWGWYFILDIISEENWGYHGQNAGLPVRWGTEKLVLASYVEYNCVETLSLNQLSQMAILVEATCV